jgi:DNA modification methylase
MPGTVRLLFADPPYNIGKDYGDGAKADRLPDEDYLIWCREWIESCATLLTDDGSMWVLICDEYADHYGIMLREAGLHRRSWIKWYETFGVNCPSNFNRCSRHLFYCVKHPKRFVFNPDAVTRPSDRQAKYNDKRADPGGKLWDDVWGVEPPIPRLTGTCSERIPDFPTQLPVALLTAIVGCASEPGDLVVDPFCGSGTAGEAAIRLGRRFVGVERREEFAEWARKRLLAVEGEINANAGR